ncbi:MAG: SDR family oxidoreductase [Pseudomonadota bacterium]
MAERILIAGATGTNGRALIEKLRTDSRVRLRALVRDPGSPAADFGGAVEVVMGDLAVPESLTAAFDGVDRAYVVTAIRPDARLLFENFFAAASAAGVTQVVKFSGLGASSDSPSEIIRQHGDTDAMLRESGLPYTIIRPNSFHQNMLAQAAGIAATGTFYLPLGDAKQSTIDVRDIAEITANVLTSDEHLGKSYDLTGPESLDFHDVASILSDVAERAIAYTPITAADAEAGFLQAGMSEWFSKALAEIQALFATGAYAEVLPNTEHLLGRRPISFRRFAEDHVDAWRGKTSAE